MRAARIFLLGMGFSLCVAAAPTMCSATGWSSRDYVALYFQHYNGKVPLPHLREVAQRTLFNHLVDPNNLSRINEASVPSDDKAEELRLILATLGSFRAAYNLAVVVGEPLQQELTLVQAYSLAVAGALSDMARTPQDHANSSAAWATLVADVIASIGDSRYSPVQSARLAEAVARHYPAIAMALSKDDRRVLTIQAQNLHLPDATIGQRNAIALMQQALIGAAP